MIERLAKSAECTIDLQDLMYRYTLDGITEIAFGERCVVNVAALGYYIYIEIYISCVGCRYILTYILIYIYIFTCIEHQARFFSGG